MKTLALINWIIIGIYVVISIMMLLELGKPLDAMGRGLTSAFLTIALILLALLVVFNLIPYKWSRITALMIGFSPVIFFVVNRALNDIQQLRWEKARKDVSIYFKPGKMKTLAEAIANKRKGEVAALLDDPDLDLDQMGYANHTMLEVATEYAKYPHEETYFEIVKMLLEKGADPNLHASDHDPLIHQIATNCSVPLFETFLQHGADPNAINRDSLTVIFQLLIGSVDRDDKMRLLLNRGADPNVTWAIKDWRYHYSPLIFAIFHNYWKICTLLVRSGADVDYVAADGRSFWSYYDQYKKEFEASDFVSEEFQELTAALAERE